MLNLRGSDYVLSVTQTFTTLGTSVWTFIGELLTDFLS